ncbi:hypothetical protein DV735_g4313, partial [Chaetothyriales sp. CBS 134920]
MATRDLLSGPITLSEAKVKASNVVQQLEYPQHKQAFFQRLQGQCQLIRAIVAHHLGVDLAKCDVSPLEYWRHGSFNVCVPARVDAPDPENPIFVMVRFPLPYRVGEATHPGNADEKLSAPTSFGLGYLVIETIPDTEGRMLSESWEDKCEDDVLQGNLQRGLARILLSLAAVPLPRIGAFRLDNAGYIHLDNRPLSVEFIMQENEDFPLVMPRHETYTRVDDYVLAHLDAFHNRLLHQPNAVEREIDGRFEMAGLAAARALFPQMLQKDLRSGPFVCTLTDLHRSNIIVDDNWNIMRIIDLEFACSQPLEFQQPPYWLGGQCADEIDIASFTPHHDRFIRILEEQEQEQDKTLATRTLPRNLSAIMRHAWESGTFWLTLAISDPIVFSSVFWYRILPCRLHLTIDHTTDFTLLANLEGWGTPDIVQKKMQDYDQYLNKLNSMFEVYVDASKS